MSNKNYDYVMKIVLVGDSGSGKSSLARYGVSQETCDHPYVSTLGVDFSIKKVKCEGLTFKLQIWDTAGAERFRSITKSYYKGSGGVFILFDVTDIHTFNSVRSCWEKQVKEQCEEHTVFYLVGTKCDQFEKREVDRETAEQEAKELRMRYFECSSQTGENVENIFVSAAEDFYNSKAMEGEKKSRNTMYNKHQGCLCHGKRQKSKKTCC